MRKLILSAAILASSLSVVALSNDILPVETITISVTENFTEVALDKLPTTVTDAVKKDYADAVLTKAYVNDDEQYKLELEVSGATNVVFIDKDGKWLMETEIEG